MTQGCPRFLGNLGFVDALVLFHRAEGELRGPRSRAGDSRTWKVRLRVILKMATMGWECGAVVKHL